jgi:hypothetical protein
MFDTIQMLGLSICPRDSTTAEYFCKYLSNCYCGSGQLRLWPGRVMVLDADDDPLMPNVKQVALRTLYPQAEMHRFFQTGQSVAILDPEG